MGVNFISMERTKRQKITLISIVVFVACVFVVFFGWQSYKTSLFVRLMKDDVAKINSTCPVMVDADTRLDSAIVLHGKTIEYCYTLIHVLKDSVGITNAKENLESVILNGVISSPSLAKYRENNATMVYNYNDKEGASILKICITPNEYKK